MKIGDIVRVVGDTKEWIGGKEWEGMIAVYTGATGPCTIHFKFLTAISKNISAWHDKQGFALDTVSRDHLEVIGHMEVEDESR